MDKNYLTEKIENFAPLSLAEEWDASGWIVDVPEKQQVQKVMICLTVTDDVVLQAKNQNCDMIVSHHPLFFVPLKYKDINIYCAHTNLDRAQGGTTDELIKILELNNYVVKLNDGGFVRYVEYPFEIRNFTGMLCRISKNIRVVNNKNASQIHKIAFCSGSGAEFIQEAVENGADAFVTGDIKFHTAIECPIVLFDIGHFESEIPVLGVFAKLLFSEVKTVFAFERSPFKSV